MLQSDVAFDWRENVPSADVLCLHNAVDILGCGLRLLLDFVNEYNAWLSPWELQYI